MLPNLGQSLWLDNITRDLLDGGTLKRYADKMSVTGLTSNPTIFDHAIKNSTAYDTAIREKLGKGKSGEALFSGKVLAQRIIPELESTAEPKLGHDSSTNSLIRRYRTLKGMS